MERSRGRRRWDGGVLKLAAVFLVVAVSLCCVWCWAPCSGGGCRGVGDAVLRSESWKRTTSSSADQGRFSRGAGGQWQRRLLGAAPGSYPPRCASKCGPCSPCYPVHVAVPPGVPVTTEYYPEAWRCKCGNRFYMP